MKNNKLVTIISVLIIILLCGAFTVRTFQNDTFYTIKVGESILKNGRDIWLRIPSGYVAGFYQENVYIK